MDPAALDPKVTRVRVVVAGAGIQSVTRAALQAAASSPTANGLYAGAALNTLKVTRKGVKVPIQLAGANEIRFHAPAPLGDRWNVNDIYIVEIDAADASPLMATRPVAVGGLPADVSTVLEPGLWVKNSSTLGYQSVHPGADGDHYFAGAIRNAASKAGASTVTVDMASAAVGLSFGNTLPAAPGTSAYTMELATRLEEQGSPSAYALMVTHAGGSIPVNVPSFPMGGNGKPLDSVSASFTLPGRPGAFTVSHVNTPAASGTLLDSVSMLRPALLQFGGNGAIFQAQSGASSFRWEGAPANGATLYDITDASAPVVLTGAGAAGFADSQATRRYLVAGPGTLQTPAVLKLTAFTFAGIKPAAAIYIVPNAGYVQALQPLLALRNQQRTTTAVVNVLALYDAYSFGWVDPFAIRRFLQQANATPAWKAVLLSTVLVGDGTVDPKNFEAKSRSLQLIPPFVVRDIDPWLMEAACDNCYGQLNDPPAALGLGQSPHLGDDPTRGQLFSTEVWIGRFPVNDVDELTKLVAKLVAYETSKFNAGDPIPNWRGRILFAADNVWKPLDEKVAGSPLILDPAGNHEQISNNIRALNPQASSNSGSFLLPRVYYALAPSKPVNTIIGPWRIQDANAMGARLLQEMNGGASILVYNGHANHFYMGDTELGNSAARGYVVEFNDPAFLHNSSSPFFMLSMTCVAAQFSKPTNSGRVIAENFLMNNGSGAIASWGPAGQSDANGHIKLQEGFFEYLYSRPNYRPRLGELLDAGYMELMTRAPGSWDSLRTFVLLGDPMTRLQYDASSSQVLLPAARR